MGHRKGRVYFIRCGDHVKVGFATSVPARFSQIKTASPHDLELLGNVPGTRDFESRLHERLKSSHHRGEWFRYSHDVWLTMVKLLAYGDRRPRSVEAEILADPYMAAFEPMPELANTV